MYGVDDIWGADLVDMQEWSRVNKGYKYMLNVIDVFSKYAWSVPLKDNKCDTVTEAFKYIVKNSSRISINVIFFQPFIHNFIIEFLTFINPYVLRYSI